MARLLFGGSSVDWLIKPYAFGERSVAELETGTTILTFWDTSDPDTSTQYTDLLDSLGNATSQITAYDHQIPLFYGPGGILAMWVDKGDGSDRDMIVSTNFGATIGGTELGFCEIATTSTPLTTITDTAVAGLSMSVEADGGPVYVALSGFYQHNFTVAHIPQVKVWDGAIGSGTLLHNFTPYILATNLLTLVSSRVRRTLSAGTHTVQVSLRTATEVGKAGFIAGAADYPFSLSVIKA